MFGRKQPKRTPPAEIRALIGRGEHKRAAEIRGREIAREIERKRRGEASR